MTPEQLQQIIERMDHLADVVQEGLRDVTQVIAERLDHIADTIGPPIDGDVVE